MAEADDSIPYPAVAAAAIRKAGVAALLMNQPSYTVAFERLARAAGTTKWYLIRSVEQVDALASKLTPGSSLSFYFDGRIVGGQYSEKVAREILEIARIDREAVLGKVGADEMELDMDYISDSSELEEFIGRLEPGTTVYYGPYPGRDNDGFRAITIDLPDLDGVVRKHPH